MLECNKCHRKAESQEELDKHFNKIHLKMVIHDNRRQDFLLTFFPPGEPRTEIEINGYILVKSWNSQTKRNQVSIHTSSTLKKYHSKLKKHS